MTTHHRDRRPSAAEIRAFRAASPLRHDRDIAEALAITEAELLAAEIGHGVTRIDPDPNLLLAHAEAFGPVMALSRNDSAVHEKIGVYEKITRGRHVSMTLGKAIDLRIFPKVWAFGFAVERPGEAGQRRSLTFFDRTGTAVHKVHARPDTNLSALAAYVEAARWSGPDAELAIAAPEPAPADADIDPALLRAEWLAMTDTHQFHGLLGRLGLSRLTALRLAGDDLACRLPEGAVRRLLEGAAATGLPIMVFVANAGIVQIHSGPVADIRLMGPWLNVMDPDFHLHLRLDRIVESHLVRKPTSDGMVTSVEAYDAAGGLVIQIFGCRKEGSIERADWRDLASSLMHGGDQA